MNQNTDGNLDPQAIAELLWHRFELQDGKALALVLDQIDQRDNRQALDHWVRRRLAHYNDRGVSQPLLQLETELACRLVESGLPGGQLDLGTHRDEIGLAPGKSEPTQPARQPRPRPGTSGTRIIPFPERSSS